MFEQVLSGMRALRARKSPRPRSGLRPRGESLRVERLEDRAIPAITLTPNPLPNAVVGVAYTPGLTAAGGVTPYRFSVVSGLPAGVTLSAAGAFSGKPTAGGPFNFTVQVSDSSTPAITGSQSYTLTVSSPTITLSPKTLSAATVGVSYSQTLAGAGGTAPYHNFTADSGLPAGLTLSTAGVLSGMPTADGAFSFTIATTDSSTGTGPYTGSQSYSLTVNPPTAITLSPATLPAATAGVSYSQTLTGDGGTAPYTFTVVSGLPAGLTLSPAGLLSGKATAVGSFTFTVTTTDSSTGTGPFKGSQDYTLTVNAPAIILSPKTLPAARPSISYSQTLSASGGTAPYKYTVVQGSLPAGVVLNPSTGLLSGKPQVLGTFTFTVKATDSSTGTGSPFSATQRYTLPVPGRLAFLTLLPNLPVAGTLPTFQVLVKDALNSPCAGVVVRLGIMTQGSVGSAGFTPGSVIQAVTGANGVATFAGVGLTTRGQYQIEAEVGQVAALSNVITVGQNGRHSL